MAGSFRSLKHEKLQYRFLHFVYQVQIFQITVFFTVIVMSPKNCTTATSDEKVQIETSSTTSDRTSVVSLREFRKQSKTEKNSFSHLRKHFNVIIFRRSLLP